MQRYSSRILRTLEDHGWRPFAELHMQDDHDTLLIQCDGEAYLLELPNSEHASYRLFGDLDLILGDFTTLGEALERVFA